MACDCPALGKSTIMVGAAALFDHSRRSSPRWRGGLEFLLSARVPQAVATWQFCAIYNCKMLFRLKCVRVIHAQELDLPMAIRLRNLFEQELASSKNLWLLGSTARPLFYLFLGILLVSSAVAHCGLRLAGIKKDWRESGYEDTFVAMLVALGTLNQSWSIEFCWCEHLWSVICIYLAWELKFTKSCSPNRKHLGWGLLRQIEGMSWRHEAIAGRCPQRKAPICLSEDGVRRSARSFPQLGSLQSLDPALEEMMTLGSKKHWNHLKSHFEWNHVNI